MDITYENICKKLGFDIKNYKYPPCSHEDDSTPSIFASLTIEESDFLIDYIHKHESEFGK